MEDLHRPILTVYKQGSENGTKNYRSIAATPITNSINYTNGKYIFVNTWISNRRRH